MKRSWRGVGAWLVAAIAVGMAGCGQQQVHWTLWTKYFVNESANMTALTCGAAQGGDLVFVATSDSSGKVATTTASCPSSEIQGDTYIDLPETSGTFTVCARLANKAKSTSLKVMGAVASDSIGVNLYAEGCDMPTCCN